MTDTATPDPTVARNDEGAFEPFTIDDVPLVTHTRGARFGMAYRHLSSFGGGSQISISSETLAPGRQANPAHYHLIEEEHVLVLEGTMTLELGGKRYELAAGHYVCFPAGQRVGHALVNRGDAPCRYLVIGNPQPHDVAVCTENGRVGVKLLGEGYAGKAMPYWDGIDDSQPAT